MAEKFEGDPRKLQQATVKSLAETLKVDHWSVESARANGVHEFCVGSVTCPEVMRWTAPQKQLLVDIIRAKSAADETKYLRLLQQHEALKKIFLRLGSGRQTARATQS